MTMTSCIAILVLLFITADNSEAASRSKQLEGFNWYNEKPKTIKETVNIKQQQVSEPQEEVLPEYEKNIRSLQDQYRAAHRKALDNPTQENILAELKFEKEMMRKSQIYGERRVVIGMMDSQFTDMKSHSNVLHKRVQEQVAAKETFEQLLKLSQEWGLILQIEDECAHCHVFSPIVLEFAQKHKFELLAANKSGNDFNGIEGVLDNGEMLIFNPVRETPMLYLVKSDGKEVFPISRGINTEDQIIINIKNIDKHIRRLF